MRGEIPGLNSGKASNTVELESSGGRRNVWCRGEMLRDHTEPRLRKQHTGSTLTLRHESVGIEQD